MAFGFLKKIVSAITGKGDAAPQKKGGGKGRGGKGRGGAGKQPQQQKGQGQKGGGQQKGQQGPQKPRGE
ncbi:MAG: hypothetical protein IIY62_07810, partial [Kiritimatiellae bacterium]|nr:hypothetical protein [Kiritimatiellia bacterium]